MATTESVSTKLEYLRRLAEGRTRGLVEANTYDCAQVCGPDFLLKSSIGVKTTAVDVCIMSKNDAACIAAAVNHFDALLDIVEVTADEHGGRNHEPECPICCALAKLQEIK